MVFAELARQLVAPTGRVGLLVPSGIATDHTTSEFFGELMESESLIEPLRLREQGARSSRTFTARSSSASWCSAARRSRRRRPISSSSPTTWKNWRTRSGTSPLSSTDLALLNPNTRTCPIFRSRRDAELTKAIYRRVPVLIDKNRKEGGNPWGIKFVTMFDQTNDAELFRDRRGTAG